MFNAATATNWKIWGAYAALYLVWGSTYLALIFALQSFPPFLLSTIRFLLAALILGAWNLKQGSPEWNRKFLLRNTLYGILMLVGGTVSVAWAEQYIPSSLAAILVTVLPFWIILLDRRQWRWYFSHWTIPLGVVAGFGGVVWLLGSGNKSQVLAADQWKGILFLALGGVSWALGSLLSKYRPAGQKITWNATVQLASAGLFTLMLSLSTGEWQGLSTVHIRPVSLIALAYLVLMGSIVTYMSYLWLLQQRPAAQVSTYVYVNPVVALLLGSWLANESISITQMLALAIILLGVLMVNLPNYYGTYKLNKSYE